LQREHIEPTCRRLRAEFLEFLVLFAEIAGHRGANRNGTGLEPTKSGSGSLT
jgi:hypothetical protein